MHLSLLKWNSTLHKINEDIDKEGYVKNGIFKLIVEAVGNEWGIFFTPFCSK